MSLLTVVAETGLTAHAVWAALLDLLGDPQDRLRRQLGVMPPLPVARREAEGMYVASLDSPPMDPAELPHLWSSLSPSPLLASVLERWHQEAMPPAGPVGPLGRGECIVALAVAAVLVDGGVGELQVAPVTHPTSPASVAPLLTRWRVRVALERVGPVTPEALLVMGALGARFVTSAPLIPHRFGRGTDGVATVSVWQGSYAEADDVTVVETNLDDMQPEFYGYLAERLLEMGALDVWLIPVLMKKGRPGTWIQVLCRPEDAVRFAGLLFKETTTLGVRVQQLRRYCLERWQEVVPTLYGPVRVKVARGEGGLLKAAPEYEDCRRLAIEHQVCLREVYDASVSAARALRMKWMDENERFQGDEQGDPHQPGSVGDPGCHPGGWHPG